MGSTSMLDFDKTLEVILETVHREFPKFVSVDINSTGLSAEKVKYNEWGESQNSQEWLDLNAGVQQVRRWLVDEGYLREQADSFGSTYTLTTAGLQCIHNLKGEAAPLPRILRE